MRTGIDSVNERRPRPGDRVWPQLARMLRGAEDWTARAEDLLARRAPSLLPLPTPPAVNGSEATAATDAAGQGSQAASAAETLASARPPRTLQPPSQALSIAVLVRLLVEQRRLYPQLYLPAATRLLRRITTVFV